MPKVSKVKRYQQQRLKEIKIAVAQRKRQALHELNGNIENLDLTSEICQLRTCDVSHLAFKVFGVKLTNIDVEDDSSAISDSSNCHPPENTSESETEEKEITSAKDVNLLPVNLRCDAHILSLCETTTKTLWKVARRPKADEII
ncbi:unnamed protein product [Euphydryas editha]|uniref:Uncharacterized protein n=1 Tax=Euphydryas editha TaxID=104508 RepID=A0AAU9TVW0_EUPED|nr:unnamed protein product [Euphydryas editha]